MNLNISVKWLNSIITHYSCFGDKIQIHEFYCFVETKPTCSYIWVINNCPYSKYCIVLFFLREVLYDNFL